MGARRRRRLTDRLVEGNMLAFGSCFLRSLPMGKRSGGALGALLLLGFPGSASAVSITFIDDEAGFLSAFGGNPVIFEDFETAPPGVPSAPFPSFTNQGVTYTAPGSSLRATSAGVFPVSGLAIFDAGGSPDDMLLQFDQSVTAVGGFVASANPTVQGNDVDVTLQVFGGSVTITLMDSDNHFIGIIDTDGFTTANFFSPGSIMDFGIDNLSFGVDPEPSTALLLTSGLAALAVGRQGSIGRSRSPARCLLARLDDRCAVS